MKYERDSIEKKETLEESKRKHRERMKKEKPVLTVLIVRAMEIETVLY